MLKIWVITYFGLNYFSQIFSAKKNPPEFYQHNSPKNNLDAKERCELGFQLLSNKKCFLCLEEVLPETALENMNGFLCIHENGFPAFYGFYFLFIFNISLICLFIGAVFGFLM